MKLQPDPKQSLNTVTRYDAKYIEINEVRFESSIFLMPEGEVQPWNVRRFDAIEQSFGLSESTVIRLMRHELKRSSFELWRKRVTGRATKHVALRSQLVDRAYCPTQYKHK